MLAVLLAAAGVFGAPTSSTQAARPIGPATTPQHAIACTFYNPAPPCTVDNGESLPLTQLGHHLFDPHAITWAQSSQPTPNAIRSLPALPGAILLALMGFACVLFANNRGRLIAVFGTLLVLSHAGLRLLPEITARYLSSRANRTHNAPAALVPPTNALLPTQAHQPVQYAGLLHRLAGSPDPAAPIVEHLSRPTRVDWLTLSQHAKAAALRWLTSQNANPPQPAFLPTRDDVSVRPALGQTSLISAGFQFRGFSLHILSRGPPQQHHAV